MKRPFLIALGSAMLTAAVLEATPASAEVPAAPDVNVSLVRTADLDLSTARGQRALEQRLAQAAREVCGEASNVDVGGKNDVRKCRDATLAQARGQRDQLLAAANRGAIIAVTAAR
jgi:UrcA family protein